MKWINNAQACLDVAQHLITETEVLFEESIKDKNLLPYIKLNIKNCLENCRSPLDCTANYIFDTYCKSEYSQKELKRMRVYFPIANNINKFNDHIDTKFRTLSNKRSDLVTILQKHQSFNGEPWLKNSNSLVNENKHRNLKKQTKTKNTHIKKGKMEGIQLENVTIVGSDNVIPIRVGNKNIDFINPSQYDHLFDASVTIEYSFSDLKIPVLPTV